MTRLIGVACVVGAIGVIAPIAAAVGCYKQGTHVQTDEARTTYDVDIPPDYRVELVADKRSKRSFEPQQGVGPETSRLIEENGAILRALGDTIAMCPPMVISEAELDELFDRFEKGLDLAEAWVAKEGLRGS